MRDRKVVIRGGLEAVKRVLEDYRRLLYSYNSLLRGTGFYLKPVHIVVRSVGGEKRTYYYIGRYWWRIVYVGKRGRTSKVKWVYVGRDKPRELAGYPDPPRNPLEGLRFYVVGEDVVLDRKTYERYRWVFEGLQVVEDQE